MTVVEEYQSLFGKILPNVWFAIIDSFFKLRNAEGLVSIYKRLVSMYAGDEHALLTACRRVIQCLAGLKEDATVRMLFVELAPLLSKLIA